MKKKINQNNFLKYILINSLIMGFIFLSAIALAQIPKIFKVMGEQAELREQIRQEVQEQLGFEYQDQSISYIRGGKGAAEAFEDSGSLYVITSITEGKPMANAGFKDRDIFPTSYFDSSGLLKQFIFLQGETIEIPIVRDRQAMDISITVPKLELSIDPYDLRWPFRKQSKLFKYKQDPFHLSVDDIYN